MLKALAATGLPGRDEYLAEQQRRKEARLASKPAWVKVRAVEAKWRKAQAKTSKAETASQHAAAAVDAAKTDLAKAEATAAEANMLFAVAKAEEASAKAEVERPGLAAETPEAENVSAVLPGLQLLPQEYRQQPEVAAKLQQMEQLLREVLAGAGLSAAPGAHDPPGTAAAAAAAPRAGDVGGAAAAHSSRSRASERGSERASSVPVASDGLWAAANAEPLRSRSPIRDGRYAGRRQAGS